MKIFTNPGSNVPGAALTRYGIVLAPQRIVVDGVSHDTRDEIPLSTVDGWVRDSHEFPYVVGTTAHEFVDLFLEALQSERELLAVTVSRRIIKSFDSAESAAHTLQGRIKQAGANVAVLGTTTTDLGSGLLCIAAGEAARAGLPLAQTVQLRAPWLRRAPPCSTCTTSSAPCVADAAPPPAPRAGLTRPICRMALHTIRGAGKPACRLFHGPRGAEALGYRLTLLHSRPRALPPYTRWHAPV